MSGWAEERKVLQSWFATQWALLTTPVKGTDVPVSYEGQTFDPPKSGGAYIEMWLLGQDEGTQVSLGTPALNRYVGMVQFTINCPLVDGGSNAQARQIADALDGLWSGRRFQTTTGHIRCRVPGLRTLGNMDGRWIAVLTVPYLRDDIRPIPPPVALSQ